MKQAFLEANIRSNRIEVPGATLEHKKAIQSKFGDQASVTLKEDGLLKIRPIKTDLLELALSIGESDSGILVPTDDIPIEKYCST